MALGLKNCAGWTPTDHSCNVKGVIITNVHVVCICEGPLALALTPCEEAVETKGVNARNTYNPYECSGESGEDLRVDHVKI